MPIIYGRRAAAGPLIGGLKETQEMLDFCGKYHILSEIELIDIAYINTAYTRMLERDIRYRFVIDMASLHE